MSKRVGIPLALAAALLLAACGGGSSGGTPGDKTAKALVLIDVSVAGFDGVPLNEIVFFEFSEDLDPDTVRPDTIQIREGPNYGIQVPGFFRVDGSRVEFYPRLPQLPDLSDCGFHAGKDYRVTLPGKPKAATVRSYANDRLEKRTEVSFATALTGSDTLFIDNFLDPLPPRVLVTNPPDGAKDVPADAKIVLTFNRRPLHPATVNETNIKLTMTARQGVPVHRPISISPMLRQSFDSVQVEVVPNFPLADEAEYEITVDRRVQDLVGNDAEGEVVTFSIRDEPMREDAIVFEWSLAERDSIGDLTNTTASWSEIVDDALCALFTVAGGNGTAGDLTPKANRNFTPDDFARGVSVETDPVTGVEYDVYNFRAIDIPSGVIVRFSPRPGGPNRPAKLLALKNIEIAGTLIVSGGIGEDGESYSGYTNSAMPKANGGAAGPGGGDGADNYTGAKIYPDVPIMDGDDVNYGGGGGKGGKTGTYTYSYSSGTTYWYKYGYSYTAGGGGGGGSREPGKPGKKGGYQYNTNYYGEGGKGGLSTTQRGYPANFERSPNVGGGGAGAGGKGYYHYEHSSGSKSQYYMAAGSGGGGGGAITVQSAGDVNVRGTGKVLADGGDGGTSSKSPYYYGGAGGGGGGGSIKLVATNEVNFDAGAEFSVRGGAGGPYQSSGTYQPYPGGDGGDGGDGYLRFEALEDENSPGKPLVNGVSKATMTYGPPSTGVFAPEGGGAPSVGQTVWLNLGVFDPQMMKPKATDVVASLFNDTMTIEVQMAVEDTAALGTPNLAALDITDFDSDGEHDDTLDPSTLSEWVKIQDIETLNGKSFQFIRVRVAFQLDPTQKAHHPLPFLDTLRIPFRF